MQVTLYHGSFFSLSEPGSFTSLLGRNLCIVFRKQHFGGVAFFFVKSENWSRFVFDNCSAEFWQFYITHLKMVWTTLSGIRTTHNGDTLLVCDIKGR